jgi:hypothetical protein
MNPELVYWGHGVDVNKERSSAEWFQYRGQWICYDCANIIENALQPLLPKGYWAWCRGEDVTYSIGYMCRECGKFWDGYERK